MLEGYKVLRELNDGETVTRPVYVSSLEDAKDKNNKSYVKLKLADGDSFQTASKFDNYTIEQFKTEGIREGCIADVTVKKSGDYYNVVNIKPTKDPSLTVDDFAKLPPLDIDKMYDEICDIIGGLPNPVPERTALSVPTLALLEEHKDKFKTSSAAVYMHHNYKGGLIYHTYRMVKAAVAMCGVYQELDREILVCATALHDIGKINEYSTDPVGAAEITDLYVLYGHLYLGAMFFSNKCTQIKNCDKERQRLLTHCILSHHGQGEWGAVKFPATPEAFALHYIDNLDAKIESCNIMYEQTEAGKNTDKKLSGFGNLYKPSYWDSKE